MQKPIIIGIAGGTGSGKTSVANAVLEDLMKNGNDVVLLEQDSYYKKNDHLSFSERVKLNYDHPNSIDFDLLEQHIIMLSNHQSIEKPIYNFAEHNRTKETERIDSKSIIIVEGILILAIEKIRNLLDMKIFVDTDDDIRLLRRMERDIQERGRSFDNVKEQYISTVKPMHLEFVEPSKRYADVIIPRGKDNEVGIKMVSSRLKYLIRRSGNKDYMEK
ncbi:uridine kinase [Streptobacillus felis]|uniref:Uridine kinase n=1 Tax=Streptobacillus felis TaxID=1384509 RepID=A0A7Z0PGL4_9FUSO|nr:uridine kinase [Streptobacillus felis]NYV28187.1 uridine kinase [Streptobacillus felis]